MVPRSFYVHISWVLQQYIINPFKLRTTHISASIMKHKLLFISLIAAVVFCSCTTSTRMTQSSPVIARNVELDPIKADIDVNQEHKLTGEGVATYIFGIRVSNLMNQKQVEGITYSQDGGFSLLNRGKNTARAIAAYNALEDCPDCDVLVHPKYEVTVKKSPLGIIFRKYTVRVSGYGAKYKNIRTEKQIKVIGSQNKEYIVVDDEK